MTVPLLGPGDPPPFETLNDQRYVDARLSSAITRVAGYRPRSALSA